MEILNPAWKQQQKRRLGMMVVSLLALQTVSVQKFDKNLIGDVVQAIAGDGSGRTAASSPNAAHMNELGQRMLHDVKPYTPVDADWAYGKARDKGGSVFLGEQISVEDAMRYNYAAGFRGWDLIRKTAIDGKESDYHPGAVGDVNHNERGDRSIGTAQMYCSPNSDIGCDGIRFWKNNFDPLVNAQHSYILYVEAWNNWGYEERFKPWQNNQAGINARMAGAEAAYVALTELYGSLK